MIMFAPPEMTPMPNPPHEIYLVRDTFFEARNGLPGWTFGKLFFGEPVEGAGCETWEGQDRRLEEEKSMRQKEETAIPIGRYRITLVNCRENGRVPCIHAIPGFTGSRILKVRDPKNLGGIVLGEYRTVEKVTMTILPHNRLVAFLLHKNMQDIPVFMNVQRAA